MNVHISIVHPLPLAYAFWFFYDYSTGCFALSSGWRIKVCISFRLIMKKCKIFMLRFAPGMCNVRHTSAALSIIATYVTLFCRLHIYLTHNDYVTSAKLTYNMETSFTNQIGLHVIISFRYTAPSTTSSFRCIHIFLHEIVFFAIFYFSPKTRYTL